MHAWMRCDALLNLAVRLCQACMEITSPSCLQWLLCGFARSLPRSSSTSMVYLSLILASLAADEVGIALVHRLSRFSPASYLDVFSRLMQSSRTPWKTTSILRSPIGRCWGIGLRTGVLIYAIRGHQLLPTGALHVEVEPPRNKDNGGTPAKGPCFVRSVREHARIWTIRTKGDGNCMWRAVARGMRCTWYTLKRNALKQALASVSDEDTREHIRLLQNRNAWGNALALQIVADFSRRRICVWTDRGMAIFRPAHESNTKPIFIAFSNHHYESVSAKHGLTLLYSCDPFAAVPLESHPDWDRHRTLEDVQEGHNTKLLGTVGLTIRSKFGFKTFKVLTAV